MAVPTGTVRHRVAHYLALLSAPAEPPKPTYVIPMPVDDRWHGLDPADLAATQRVLSQSLRDSAGRPARFLRQRRSRGVLEHEVTTPALLATQRSALFASMVDVQASQPESTLNERFALAQSLAEFLQQHRCAPVALPPLIEFVAEVRADVAPERLPDLDHTLAELSRQLQAVRAGQRDVPDDLLGDAYQLDPEVLGTFLGDRRAAAALWERYTAAREPDGRLIADEPRIRRALTAWGAANRWPPPWDQIRRRLGEESLNDAAAPTRHDLDVRASHLTTFWRTLPTDRRRFHPGAWKALLDHADGQVNPDHADLEAQRVFLSRQLLHPIAPTTSPHTHPAPAPVQSSEPQH